MKLPFDPLKEVVLRVVRRDGAKDYTLRFGMRELERAERSLGVRALANGAKGVGIILEKLTDDSLDSLSGLLFFCLERRHPDITLNEVWDILDADLSGAYAATRSVLGMSLPEAKPEELDPNEQPAAMEIPTEQTVPIGT